jgi:hypothetical protein
MMRNDRSGIENVLRHYKGGIGMENVSCGTLTQKRS